MDLIEREEQLGTLTCLADQSAGGSGQVVLIGAEAGAGKSALLQAFAERVHSDVELRLGRCDELSTPASFAPLWDMAATLPGSVTDALTAGGRTALFAALREELRSSPSILAFDDVQWADEATIDLLRHLGRRIDDMPLVLCVAYRSDEIDRGHALHGLLGELGPRSIRVELPPLSMPAVERMVAGRDVDLADVYARTGGNPFFVAEVLAHPDVEVPAAVGDAVLARTAALSESVWEILDLVALAPEGLPLDLIVGVSATAESDADAAVERGLLEVVSGRLRCRHDLVRAALAETILPVRRRRLHRVLLELLADRATTAADVAQLAHHAVAAEDEQRAVTYSMRAAERASADGAHRQAARHYSHALRYRSHLTEADLEQVLERMSYEAYYSHDMAAALGSALELRDRRSADPLLAGRTSWWCSRLARFAGDRERAVALAEEAVASTSLGGDPLYEHYSRWWLAMLLEDSDDIERWGRSTAALARDAGELGIAAHALNGVAMSLIAAGDASGRALMEESLELARSGESLEQTARVFNNLAHNAMLHRRADADRWFEEGLAWVGERDLMFWWDAMIDSRSMLRLMQGRWSEAMADVETTLSSGASSVGMQMCALATRATIMLRQGNEGAAEAVEALMSSPVANPGDDLYVVAARLEQAWLERTIVADTSEAGRAALASVGNGVDSWHAAAIAFWLCKIDRSSLDGVDATRLPRPLERELAGDRAGAVEAWEEVGGEFEAAVLRGMSDDPGELRTAFEYLGQLGATATIAALRRDAAARGMRAVPRGSRATTLADPAGLTERQAEVLELLGDRLTNAEIAERLVISEKTAGHHVSAILMKLGVATRTEAGSHARQRRARS